VLYQFIMDIPLPVGRRPYPFSHKGDSQEHREFCIKHDKEYFNPDIPEEFIPELRIINRLQTFFRQYETEETQNRLDALRELRDDLNNQEIEGTFLAGGSIAFGMAERDSDFDILWVGDMTWYGSHENYYAGLANLTPFLQKRLPEIMGRPVDVCEESMSVECMLPLLKRDLKKKQEFYYDIIHTNISNFYGYYHVNRPIDNRLDGLVREIDELRKTNLKFDVAMRRAGPLMCHGRSFAKYNKRLTQRKIPIPKEIIDLEIELISDFRLEEYKDTLRSYESEKITA